MKERTIILEGERLQIEVRHASYSREILDVPRYGELWNRAEIARGTRLELDAVSNDGTAIQGVYRIIRAAEDGVLEIEPWSDRDKVGGGQE